MSKLSVSMYSWDGNALLGVETDHTSNDEALLEDATGTALLLEAVSAHEEKGMDKVKQKSKHQHKQARINRICINTPIH